MLSCVVSMTTVGTPTITVKHTMILLLLVLDLLEDQVTALHSQRGDKFTLLSYN